MRTLWLLPLAIVGLGLAVTALLVRRLNEVTAGLRDQLERFAEIQSAVTALRSEASATRSTLDTLSQR